MSNPNPFPASDQRQTPYSNIGISEWLKILSILGAIAVSSVAQYISFHDEQLKTSMKLDNLTEKLSDANNSHTAIHATLNKRLDELEVKVENLESTTTSLYGAINARKVSK